MISIFSTLKLRLLPWLPIDFIRFEVFKRLDKKEIVYWTDLDDKSLETGCIRKIPCKFKNKYLRFLERIYWMRKIKPDFILVIGAPLDLLFVFLKPKKSKIILHLNGPLPSLLKDWRYYFYPIFWLVVIFIIKRATVVITVSKYVAESISHLIEKEKIFVIYNGVNTKIFNPNKRNKNYLQETYQIDSSKPLITFIGALIKRKRPEIILKLAQLHKDKMFVIVGKGPEELKIKKFIKNSNNLIWINKMGREDVACLLASSDIFLFPSLFEGFGMVIIEAMACGCPVIVTDHGALSELVDHEVNGIKIPYSNDEVELFSQYITKILQNKDFKNRLIAGGLFKIKSLNYDKISLQWEEILKKFKNQNRRLNKNVK